MPSATAKRPPGRDLEWVLPLLFVGSSVGFVLLVSLGLPWLPW